MERIWEVLGVLHQLIGISDVRQAEPEDGPHPINKAAITVFKVPEETKRETTTQILFIYFFKFKL